MHLRVRLSRNDGEQGGLLRVGQNRPQYRFSCLWDYCNREPLAITAINGFLKRTCCAFKNSKNVNIFGSNLRCISISATRNKF
ncbi:hypothetical protein DdX_01327 [Ditylenchus destructor]|uniref:Uncharacterized protein n=1 Tax=Ditylenchus destructor TaxID=166010 RepID=A0AAD4NIL4_9BILA|nr:hypothetical protein DdX_01327 [Ditylenchus destructor]